MLSLNTFYKATNLLELKVPRTIDATRLLDIKLIALYRISDGVAKGLTQSPVSVNVECRMSALYPISGSGLGSTVNLTVVYCHFSSYYMQILDKT